MDGAIEEEVVHDAVGGSLGRGLGGQRVVVPATPEMAKVVIHPNGNHEQKGEAGRVEEEVELVELVGRGSAVGGHNLLEKDIRRDKDQGRAKCARKADDIGARNIERACEHDPNGEGKKRDICAERIADAKEQSICSHGEQG